MMFGPGFQGVRSFDFRRAFGSSLRSLNAVAFGSAKLRGRADAKTLLQRTSRRKQRARREADVNPLYMEIPLAMKYLRAAEVGNSAKRTTVSVHISIIPERGIAPLQGQLSLPRPLKETCALVFTSQTEQIRKLEDSGLTYKLGGSTLVEEISSGLSLNQFTQCFATPEMVPLLKPIQRTLGIAGLMPMAKKGTVADDIFPVVEESAGQITFKMKDHNLAIPVGRCDFTDEEIIRNIKAVSERVASCQVGSAKKHIVGRCSLSSTNGPSMVINFKDL